MQDEIIKNLLLIKKTKKNALILSTILICCGTITLAKSPFAVFVVT